MNGLSNLTAAVLVGGLGTRLRPSVAGRPKVLAEVGGRPFLAYVLDQLGEYDIRRVVLCAGYLGVQIQNTFGYSYGSMRLLHTRESSPLGTGGALRLAIDFFDSDSVLAMNGDSFCELDLNAFWKSYRDKDANSMLLLTKQTDTRPYGQVRVDNDGLVLSFSEKGKRTSEGWISAGIYLIKRDLFFTIPKNRTVSLEREIFPGWIGNKFYGYITDGNFLDIGMPEDYAAAEKFFVSLKKCGKFPRISF